MALTPPLSCRLQKPETHTIGKFAKGGNHFCQLPSCPILAEKAARPLKAGKTKKAQRCMYFP